MALPKVSQKVALFIVIPAILTMLVAGIVMWPSEEEKQRLEEKRKAKADSLNLLKKQKESISK